MNYIKFIRIFLLVLIIIGLGLLATQKMWVPRVVDMIVTRDWKTYTNTKYGYIFKYPSNANVYVIDGISNNIPSNGKERYVSISYKNQNELLAVRVDDDIEGTRSWLQTSSVIGYNDINNIHFQRRKDMGCAQSEGCYTPIFYYFEDKNRAYILEFGDFEDYSDATDILNSFKFTK